MEYNSSWGNEVVFALSTNKAKRKTATLNGRVNAHHFVEFEIMCFSVSRVMNSKSIKISLIFEHPLQELHQLYSEVYSNCRHC